MTVLLMIGAFVLSWTPYSVVALISAFGDMAHAPSEVYIVPAAFAKASIIWNPIIYMARHNEFRRACNKTFKNVLQKLHDNSSSFSSTPNSQNSKVAKNRLFDDAGRHSQAKSSSRDLSRALFVSHNSDYYHSLENSTWNTTVSDIQAESPTWLQRRISKLAHSISENSNDEFEVDIDCYHSIIFEQPGPIGTTDDSEPEAKMGTRVYNTKHKLSEDIRTSGDHLLGDFQSMYNPRSRITRQILGQHSSRSHLEQTVAHKRKRMRKTKHCSDFLESGYSKQLIQANRVDKKETVTNISDPSGKHIKEGTRELSRRNKRDMFRNKYDLLAERSDDVKLTVQNDVLSYWSINPGEQKYSLANVKNCSCVRGPVTDEATKCSERNCKLVRKYRSWEQPTAKCYLKLQHKQISRLLAGDKDFSKRFTRTDKSFEMKDIGRPRDINEQSHSPTYIIKYGEKNRPYSSKTLRYTQNIIENDVDLKEQVEDNLPPSGEKHGKPGCIIRQTTV